MRLWSRGRRSFPPPAAVPALVGSVLGDLAGPAAVVDEYGRVAAIDGSWTVEWGVGADDRWRTAHEEVAVRQVRIDDAPVYETRMRVPSGDVIQRVAAVNDGESRAVVIELDNSSPAPLAVAVVGQVTGPAVVEADTAGIGLDGVRWLVPERPAGAVWAGTGDPWGPVVAGPERRDAHVDGVDPSAALVLALPHRQQLVVWVVIEGEPPERVVRPAEVAAGWRIVTADALAIEVPDADLVEAWRRILPDLVVQAGSADPRAAAEAAPVLEAAGLGDEAARARLTVAEAVERGDLDDEDLAWAWQALAGHGVLVAADERRLGAVLADRTPVPRTPPVAAAGRVLGRLVGADTIERVALLPEVPASWRGGVVDVRSLGTRAGRVSFSVRWHGERPALLWERLGGPDGVELTCPGLDPAWSSSERSGEALLAAPTDPTGSDPTGSDPTGF